MNKVMIFDLDDTLYDQLSGFEYAYYRHFGDTDIGVERLYRHFRLYSEELFEATQTGALSVPDMHVVRITRAVADYDIELPEEKAHAFQRDYEYAQQHIKLSTTIVEMLQYLVQKNVKLGLLTNGESDRQRAKIKALGLDQYIPKSNMFVSAELGLSKPDPAIFETVGKQMDVGASDAYFIGDHFDNDILGAMQVGWKAIWYNRRNRPQTDMTKQPTKTVMTEKALFEAIQNIIESA
ncbi:HAD family hydrolase [Staphylococcus pseudintermedius]|uniref:HAD family hydrolase n=1 Tax=Staphylococcus pseudintermedius TaxID=283734 RepID=A0A317YU15_STAPS|nr:HAD family hydrolase [Staphylococcus pseudintermedius]MDK3707006.1 HAD family hydrolase [Staphylococcus pseudintermedius]PWZ77169.1 HAD family hydrolase [Staphylococcus pseudintermedius]REA67616.1 HAD family hydrolase [Staphylococcus pseudintermedius]UAR95324.1 HAD family hydrolase [Staphylococcus pseudintermedius]UAR99309.1 HAD family hydrolase [Staphylococcus pseudintermedius]